MNLVDTSVWIDYLRAGDATLSALLRRGQVLIHPFVVGEIGPGSLKQRSQILAQLGRLPQVGIASDEQVMCLIAAQALYGLGTGYVDVHLLAAVHQATGTWLWTRDKRLLAAAQRLGIAAPPHVLTA